MRRCQDQEGARRRRGKRGHRRHRDICRGSNTRAGKEEYHREADDLPVLEDVQSRMRDKLSSASIPTERSTRADQDDSDSDKSEANNEAQAEVEGIHPLWKALDSPPGFRERVRRAARRLALGITHDSDTAQTIITTTSNGRIELIQGGKPLRTVQDLSFAKGVVHIRGKK